MVNESVFFPKIKTATAFFNLPTEVLNLKKDHSETLEFVKLKKVGNRLYFFEDLVEYEQLQDVLKDFLSNNNLSPKEVIQLTDGRIAVVSSSET